MKKEKSSNLFAIVYPVFAVVLFSFAIQFGLMYELSELILVIKNSFV